MAADAASLFSIVGTAAGDHLATWCPSAGARLRHHLLKERAHAASSGPLRIVIDVGCFDATDAISFATATQRPVWTFEPTPSKHAGIRRRLIKAGVSRNVTLFPYALSNITGEGRLEVLRAPKPQGRKFMENGSLGSAQDLLVQDMRPSLLPTAQAGVIAVPVRQLDAILAAHAPPDVRVAYMKVDAQGFDLLALKGAREALKAGRIEVFAFEFSPFLMPGRADGGIKDLTWLESLGYQCVPCNQAHTTAVRLRHAASIREFVGHFRGRTGRYDDIVCKPPAPARASSSSRRRR